MIIRRNKKYKEEKYFLIMNGFFRTKLKNIRKGWKVGWWLQMEAMASSPPDFDGLIL